MLLYAREELFDPQALAGNAASALADESVRTAVAPTIAAAIAEVSPSGEPAVAEVTEALANPRVADRFGNAAGVAAERLFGAGNRDLQLNLAQVTATAVSVTRGVPASELGIASADFDSARLDLIGGQAALALDAAERLGWLAPFLTLLGLGLLILSVPLAPDPLRGLATASLALCLAALTVPALLYVAREIVIAQFDDELTRDAVSGGWSALLGDLRTGAFVVAAAAGALALGSGLAAGGSRRHRRSID